MGFWESGILGEWDFEKVRKVGKWDFGKAGFWKSGLLGKRNSGNVGFWISGILFYSLRVCIYFNCPFTTCKIQFVKRLS